MAGDGRCRYWRGNGSPANFSERDALFENRHVVTNVDFALRLFAAGDGQDATWRLSGYSFLYITRDAKVADLRFEGSQPRIYLNGHTLRVRTPRHALGTNPATQVIPGGTAENPGQIIWFNPTLIMVK